MLSLTWLCHSTATLIESVCVRALQVFQGFKFTFLFYCHCLGALVMAIQSPFFVLKSEGFSLYRRTSICLFICFLSRPSHGGDHCEGISEDYRLCNRQPCPKNKDFRAEQCADRNNEIVYENQRHKWLPYEPFNRM